MLMEPSKRLRKALKEYAETVQEDIEASRALCQRAKGERRCRDVPVPVERRKRASKA